MGSPTRAGWDEISEISNPKTRSSLTKTSPAQCRTRRPSLARPQVHAHNASPPAPGNLDDVPGEPREPDITDSQPPSVRTTGEPPALLQRHSPLHGPQPQGTNLDPPTCHSGLTRQSRSSSCTGSSAQLYRRSAHNQLTRQPSGQHTAVLPILLSLQPSQHRLPIPAPPHRPCHHSSATQALPHMTLHTGRLCLHWPRHRRLRLTGPPSQAL
jgi:hypothetical protein